jgi:hypothetical protein
MLNQKISFIIVLVGMLLGGGVVANAADRKVLIGYGWDFLEATTDDVYRNRAKFADSGVDGVLMSIDGKREDGSAYKSRYVMTDSLMLERDFEKSRKQIAEITASKGLQASMALMLMTPKKRISWDDDHAWAVISNNVSMIARIAKSGGMRGLAIDHEDYYRARQFNQTPDDPKGVWETARKRGRQVFGGLFAEFPNAKVLGFWMFSDGGRLWRAFLNGMLDVMPMEARLIDGNESYGYQADSSKGDFRSDAWYITRSLRNTAVCPENRRKYDNCVSVSFGQYLDSYLSTNAASTYFIPPLNGSRIERLEDNLSAAVHYSDDLVWIYGERGTWIDWDRKDHPKLKPQTWSKRFPDFVRALRIAAGEGSAIEEDVAAGKLVNLISNSGCDGGSDGKIPKPYSGWSRLKEPPPEGIFSYEPNEGCEKSGSLRLRGDGCYCIKAKGIIPGESVYVRAKVKGNGVLGYDWQIGNKRLWYTNRMNFSPAPGSPEVKGWKDLFVRLRAPDDVNDLNLVLSAGPGEGSVLFDDICVYVKSRK